MDCNAAIEDNREALKRVLAMLVAMAGLGGGNPATLPRHLHRAILRLLRPAESAARRLIIVMARGLVVTLAPTGPSKPKPTSTILRNGIGTGIVMPRGWRHKAGTPAACSRALPLFDPLPRWGASPRPAASGFPRISIPGLTQPFPVPRAPSSDDPIDAARLALRLGALGRALDDLPREARRFARWRARAADAAHKPDAAGTQKGNSRRTGRFRRVWPLRPGRPPGGRLSRYDPDAPRRKNTRDVDEILAHAHALARFALSPDTS
ncbi:hypothetical protein [Mesorhizobium sp. KR9-304]|uniref:hypothetical protein n=1 Tax=Mesorhizobium sp. KR9-304 TaxID=3156614 RepID=UPI0032B41145